MPFPPPAAYTVILHQCVPGPCFVNIVSSAWSNIPHLLQAELIAFSPTLLHLLTALALFMCVALPTPAVSILRTGLWLSPLYMCACVNQRSITCCCSCSCCYIHLVWEDKVFTLAWRSNKLRLLVQRAQGPTCLLLPSAWIINTHHHTGLFFFNIFVF